MKLWLNNDGYDGEVPRKSVTLSVMALDALTRALSLSSYFIFISKNPKDKEKENNVFLMMMNKGGSFFHLKKI